MLNNLPIPFDIDREELAKLPPKQQAKILATMGALYFEEVLQENPFGDIAHDFHSLLNSIDNRMLLGLSLQAPIMLQRLTIQQSKPKTPEEIRADIMKSKEFMEMLGPDTYSDFVLVLHEVMPPKLRAFVTSLNGTPTKARLLKDYDKTINTPVDELVQKKLKAQAKRYANNNGAAQTDAVRQAFNQVALNITVPNLVILIDELKAGLPAQDVEEFLSTGTQVLHDLCQTYSVTKEVGFQDPKKALALKDQFKKTLGVIETALDKANLLPDGAQLAAALKPAKKKAARKPKGPAPQ